MERTMANARKPWFVLERQPMEEVVAGARILYPALGHCSFHGESNGIEMTRSRSATVFSRWHFSLPDQRVFVTREMMGL